MGFMSAVGWAIWGKGSPIVKDFLLKQLNRLICLWVVDSGGPKEVQVQSYSPGGVNVYALIEGTLAPPANAIEPSDCGDYAAYVKLL